jgi:short subunit dehydrogenase-like uncharacterized protein
MVPLGNRYFRYIPEGFLTRIVPKPGTGPSEEVRENGRYEVETYTTTSSGARYRAIMAQRGDYGYKATSLLFAESSLGLAVNRDDLSELRGVVTPATAMGDVLLERLPTAGVTLVFQELES